MKHAIWNEHDVIELALCELHRARRLYPNWPADLVHASAVVVEEASEVLKAANDAKRQFWQELRFSVLRSSVGIAAAGRFGLDTFLPADLVRPAQTGWRSGAPTGL